MIRFEAGATNHYAQTTNTISIPSYTTGGTLMFWYRPFSISDQGIMGYPATSPLFAVKQESADLLVALWTKNKWVTATNVLAYDTLVHVAATYLENSSKTDTDIYIDGVLDTSGSNTKDVPAVQVFDIGRFDGSYLNGALEDIRIYDRVLTADEIMSIYACRGHDGMWDDLWYRWQLDDGAEGATASAFQDFAVGTYGPQGGTVYNSPSYVGSELATRRVA
jgi:hypothetical protein